MSEMETRVLLADDHALIRAGIRSLLEKNSSLRVVGESSTGRDTVDKARELRPDIIIMDIGMPELNGIEATRRVRRECPGAKVIALSMHADKRYILSMFEAGASGFVVKTSCMQELSQAVQAVRHNQKFISPAVTGAVVDEYLQGNSRTQNPSVLSTREREVLQLLSEGRTSVEIASLLHISSSTAETHRRNIMKKLNLHSVAELTRYAIREGIAPL